MYVLNNVHIPIQSKVVRRQLR